MHEEWEIRSLPSEETLEKTWRNLKEKIGSEMKVFGRCGDRAIERNEVRIARGRIYRTSVKLDRWRCRKVSRKVSNQVSRIWPLTDTGVEKVSRYKTSDTRDEARSIHQVSRSYRGDRNFLDWPRCRGGVEIATRKSLEAQPIAKCQEGVEEVSS